MSEYQTAEWPSLLNEARSRHGNYEILLRNGHRVFFTKVTYYDSKFAALVLNENEEVELNVLEICWIKKLN